MQLKLFPTCSHDVSSNGLCITLDTSRHCVSRNAVQWAPTTDDIDHERFISPSSHHRLVLHLTVALQPNRSATSPNCQSLLTLLFLHLCCSQWICSFRGRTAASYVNTHSPHSCVGFKVVRQEGKDTRLIQFGSAVSSGPPFVRTCSECPRCSPSRPCTLQPGALHIAANTQPENFAPAFCGLESRWLQTEQPHHLFRTPCEMRHYRSFLGEGGKTDTQTRGKLVVQEVALFGGPEEVGRTNQSALSSIPEGRTITGHTISTHISAQLNVICSAVNSAI